MQVALLISGIARQHTERNIKAMLPHFGEDCFFATWSSHTNEFSNLFRTSTYEEPTIQYNPWTDTRCECASPKYHAYRKEFESGKYPKGHKLEHATKQLIGHALQLRDIPVEYDLIVRARWDTYVSSRVDFTKYLEEAYNDNKAIGFAIRGGRHTDINTFKEYQGQYWTNETPQSVSRDWMYWLNDNLIIHRRDAFDVDKALRLDKQSRLLPAEYGWYQMLSVDDNHKCVYGGAAIDRFVRR